MPLRTGRTVWVRPATAEDGRSVVGLVTADRLPMLTVRWSPPHVDAELREALRQEAGTAVLVVHDGSGQVLGAMALNRVLAAGGRTAEVAWLHCREDPGTAAVLVQALRERSAGLDLVSAFGRPTAWPPHIPGLPLHHRPVTTDAFTTAGFRPRHQWLLLHRGAAGSGSGAAGDRPARALRWITPDGALHTGRALPLPRPSADLGRHLLGRSLEALDRADEYEAVATVDLLAPDASARCDTLTRAGFEEVDLLRSFVLA
ncbi:hypothetical protein WN990_18830 [Kitasatospora purpeofusca]|uniref:hypothetical protein n=1 Tax=Kitasatospora purpeofusca TaxID=67352 RepID=UPI0030F2AEF7